MPKVIPQEVKENAYSLKIQGHTNREISKILQVSENTVSKWLSNCKENARETAFERFSKKLIANTERNIEIAGRISKIASEYLDYITNNAEISIEENPNPLFLERLEAIARLVHTSARIQTESMPESKQDVGDKLLSEIQEIAKDF